MTKGEEKMAAFKWKLSRKLQKPIGKHEQAASNAPAGLELHAPDPETHGHGSTFQESEKVEQGKVCPSCNSPAHAHDTKCPWCGAAL